MVFSSTAFLFLFLPIVLVLHFVLRGVRFRNVLLLLASLLFYAWSEQGIVLLLIASIVLNYSFGLGIDRCKDSAQARTLLIAAIAMNLAVLAYFKYTSFLIGNLNWLLAQFHWSEIKAPKIHLPAGISFFTFHAISYIVDIYRRSASAQRNPIKLALYFDFFPQLIAGPIVRYHDIESQLDRRSITLDDVSIGIQRFVIGLAKKMLVANTLAQPADEIFAIAMPQLTPGVAWLGIVCYTLQIYFDFSGYSDMAIGLARVFGFRFLENFNYPYVARSIREFWRRWHISLSNWFRDYLYIPLGGNRCSPRRQYFNLLVVFSLCGLWHGASLNFLIWGLFHGAFLVLERRVGCNGWSGHGSPCNTVMPCWL